ncbi:hypothetical protein HMPREF3213_01229 [Heyndrickxia coagulans]|uniref:Uncharacterized protein n=1 Tax=Heyndrickxia coagulans TaxID=1398 RepID=A0A133KV64_HEYCO|nr:hypothetical protein HMPREF3213_01229 [Heyndrickxia coagulans]
MYCLLNIFFFLHSHYIKNVSGNQDKRCENKIIPCYKKTNKYDD